jgi:hypothetical protein
MAQLNQGTPHCQTCFYYFMDGPVATTVKKRFNSIALFNLIIEISNNGKYGKEQKIQIDQHFIFKPVEVIILSNIFI